MLKVHNTSLVPPGGWKYTDPDTGALFGVPTYPAMQNKVAVHRRGNNLKPLSQAEVEHIMCLQASEGVCGGNREDVPVHIPNQPVAAKMSGTDVLNGTKVIFSLKKSGGKLVSPEVAESRARICSKCPQNVPYEGGCATCVQQLSNIVKKVVGEGKTSMDENLKACGVCKCINKVQVWVPYEHLVKGITRSMDGLWPSECWKNPENNV